MLKRYTFWFSAAIMFQLLTGLIHSISLLVNPVPESDVERQMLELMTTHKMNMGPGFTPTFYNLFTALSSCFTFLCIFAALINGYLLFKHTEPSIMKGIIGRFFMQFALTVVFSVGVSLLVSLTLTPMLSSIFLKPGHAGAARKGTTFTRVSDALERWYKKIEKGYRPILAFALDHRGAVLIGSLVVFVLSMYMVRFIGKEFVPPEDQAQFIVRLESPIDYSFGQAEHMFMQAEKVVRDRPEVVGAFFAHGLGQGGSGQVNKATIFTRLVPRDRRDKKQHEIMAELRKSLNTIPGIKATTEMVSMLGGASGRCPSSTSSAAPTWEVSRRTPARS